MNKRIFILGLLAVVALLGSCLWAEEIEVDTCEPPSDKTTVPATKRAISRGPYTENMSADQKAWEDTLEKLLSDFHWPRYQNLKRKGIESAWDYVKDDPKLPRVLIIGDSISRGYPSTATSTSKHN